MTLTVSQPPGTGAKQAVDNLLMVWTKSFMKGKWFTDFRRKTGMLGHVRAIEWTFSENGYHPHIHVAFVFDNVPAPGVAESLLERWVSTAHLLQTYASRSAQDAHRVRAGEARERVASYLTKQNAKRQSHPGKGRTPGDLLHSIVESRNDEDIFRLQEFHRATSGRSKISASMRFWNLAE